MSGQRALRCDVCVVGAGIVGLAHAIEARRRGLSVVVLERDERAVGASINNFGHLFVGSQPDGAVLEMALAARCRWLELGAAAGLEIVTEGTLILARATDELAVLETALAEPARQARLLSAGETHERVSLGGTGIIGALHSPLDLRVDPRRAVTRLAGWLGDDPGLELRFSTRVHAVEPGRVQATNASGLLDVVAEAIVVCPGADFRHLGPELGPGTAGLTRCQLQMLRLRAGAGTRIGPALATGLSLIRYPAFSEQPPTVALRARLGAERPELLEAGIHLLVTQLPDGDLIVGDSHRYGDTLDAFSEERIWSLLLDEAEGLLGQPLDVRQRWIGEYACRATPSEAYTPFHVGTPMAGVRVVENVAGIGMTLSFGFAPIVVDQLTGTVA